MLADGKLEAFHTARAPSTFYSEPDRGRRLFPDDVAVEQDDFARTRIFPIMHLIAIRRAVYRANPWVAIQPVRGVRRQPAHHLTRG